ncbi:hypothetical protein FOPG_16646, partial [Fusarium oxysporum f. sp. conglutinans race 2 54008]
MILSGWCIEISQLPPQPPLHLSLKFSEAENVFRCSPKVYANVMPNP